jgi:hypothetical protein
MLNIGRGWNDAGGFWEMKEVVVVTARVESMSEESRE